MNQNTTTTRLDPMTNVMPYELLEAAHQLMERRPNKLYWDAVPVPKRPVGQVRFEVARQISTFAVPLLVLALAYAQYGLKGLLLALPAAWLLGFVLDKMLERDIDRKFVRDANIDRGRFGVVSYLAQHMGMEPREITLDVIYKMAADFRKVDGPVRAAKAKAEADRKEAIAQSVRRRGTRRTAEATGAVFAAGAAAAAMAEDTYIDTTVADEPFSYLGNVNPSNGLPMISGTTLDVAGNQFGTDSFM